MPIIKFFKKLTGLVRGGKVIESPASQLIPELETHELREEMPEGDRIAKKRNWISSKHGKG